MTTSMRLALAALAVPLATAAFAQSLNWKQMPGSANDIGVGPTGEVWAIGTDGSNEFGIHRFYPVGSMPPITAYTVFPVKPTPVAFWVKVPGSAVRIDVGPEGPWVVNAAGGIYKWNGRAWDHMPGEAVDVGVGADGSVWVIGRIPEPGGYGIYRWTGSNWNKIPGSASRIDVDPRGNAWVVTSGNAIFRYDGTKFVPVPGAATDIGIGAEGSVFIVGTDGGVHKWNGSTWVKRDGGFTNISVDNAGRPWGVNASKQVWWGDR